MVLHEGSASRMPSCRGIAATTIQSVAASRPMRAPPKVVTMVENVLLMRPRIAAAIQRTATGERRHLAIADLPLRLW
jgi:hypothetical protein